MNGSKEALDKRAASVARAIRSSFPDVPLPKEVPVGVGWWEVSEAGESVYHFAGDGLDIEAFFRGVPYRDVVGKTPAETVRLSNRLLREKAAMSWAHAVGEPLLSWPCASWSLSFMRPQTQAYYFPAYVLTILPILTEMPFGRPLASEGKPSLVEIAGGVVEALIPPGGLDVWKALIEIPPEKLSLSFRNVTFPYQPEDFLLFAGRFDAAQKQAISEFLELALSTWYQRRLECEREEIEALEMCWLGKTGT